MHPDSAEDLDSTDEGIKAVTELIDDQVKSGVPINKIGIGGLIVSIYNKI